LRHEAVAALRHRLDEARIVGPVAERPAQALDALGQRLVANGHAPPNLLEEAVLGDQPALLAHQQGEGIEISRVERHPLVAAKQLPLRLVETERAEPPHRAALIVALAHRHRPNRRAPAREPGGGRFLRGAANLCWCRSVSPIRSPD